jgi:hypothetical protein
VNGWQMTPEEGGPETEGKEAYGEKRVGCQKQTERRHGEKNTWRVVIASCVSMRLVVE